MWLSPFYRSPMADFGYDVADFCDVDPLFGISMPSTPSSRDAHEHGLKVLVDLVPNHTSDQHPWFGGRRSRGRPEADWYVWKDPPPTGRRRTTGGPVLTDGPGVDLRRRHGPVVPPHCPRPQQPDLNWRQPRRRRGHARVMRFPARSGRRRVPASTSCTASAGIPSSSDDVPRGTRIPTAPRTSTVEHPRAISGAMRRLADAYPGDRVLMGETALPGTRRVAPYYGDGDELHLAFNFAATHAVGR